MRILSDLKINPVTQIHDLRVPIPGNKTRGTLNIVEETQSLF